MTSCKHCGKPRTNKVCCPQHPDVVAGTKVLMGLLEKDIKGDKDMVTGIKRDNAKCIGRKIGLPPNPNQPKPVDELSREEAMQEISDIVVNSCADFDCELERAYQLLNRLKEPVKASGAYINADTIRTLFSWPEEVIAKYGNIVGTVTRIITVLDGAHAYTEPLYELSEIQAVAKEHEEEIKKAAMKHLENIDVVRFQLKPNRK